MGGRSSSSGFQAGANQAMRTGGNPTITASLSSQITPYDSGYRTATQALQQAYRDGVAKQAGADITQARVDSIMREAASNVANTQNAYSLGRLEAGMKIGDQLTRRENNRWHSITQIMTRTASGWRYQRYNDDTGTKYTDSELSGGTAASALFDDRDQGNWRLRKTVNR